MFGCLRTNCLTRMVTFFTIIYKVKVTSRTACTGLIQRGGYYDTGNPYTGVFSDHPEGTGE